MAGDGAPRVFGRGFWIPFSSILALTALVVSTPDAPSQILGKEGADWLNHFPENFTWKSLGTWAENLLPNTNGFEVVEGVSFHAMFDAEVPDPVRDAALGAGGVVKGGVAYTATQDHVTGLVSFTKAAADTDTSHYYRWNASTHALEPVLAPVATPEPTPASRPEAPPVLKDVHAPVVQHTEIHDPHEREWHLSQIAHVTSGAPTDTELASLQAFLKNHGVTVSDDEARAYYAEGSYTSGGVQHSLWRSAFRDTQVVDKDGVVLAAFFSTPKI